MNTNPLELIQAFSGLPFYLQMTIIVLILFAGGLYLQFRRLSFRHLYDTRKHQIDRIESYLNSDRMKTLELSPLLNRILMAEREDRIFAHVFGYSLDAGRRDKLVPIVLAQNSPANWSQVKEARQYLKIENGELLVRYKKSDIWKNRVSLLVTVFYLMCAWGLLVVVYYAGNLNSAQKWIVGFFSIPMAGVSLVALFSTIGFKTALRIERWLNGVGKSN